MPCQDAGELGGLRLSVGDGSSKERLIEESGPAQDQGARQAGRGKMDMDGYLCHVLVWMAQEMERGGIYGRWIMGMGKGKGRLRIKASGVEWIQ